MLLLSVFEFVNQHFKLKCNIKNELCYNLEGTYFTTDTSKKNDYDWDIK